MATKIVRTQICSFLGELSDEVPPSIADVNQVFRSDWLNDVPCDDSSSSSEGDSSDSDGSIDSDSDGSIDSDSDGSIDSDSDGSDSIDSIDSIDSDDSGGGSGGSGDGGSGGSGEIWVNVVTHVERYGDGYRVHKLPIKVLDSGDTFYETLACCCDSLGSEAGSIGGSDSGSENNCCESATINVVDTGFETLVGGLNYIHRWNTEFYADTTDALCVDETISLSLVASNPATTIAPSEFTMLIAGPPQPVTFEITFADFPEASVPGIITITRECGGFESPAGTHSLE